jgi:hypothetical protein
MTPKIQKETKMDSVPYKGYMIQLGPYQLADSGEWTINISILHDTGSAVNIRNFSAEKGDVRAERA